MMNLSMLGSSLNNSHLEACTDYWCYVQTSLIVIITILIVLTNLMDIIVIGFSFESFNVEAYFMISLACADLGVGILVTPFSIQSSLYQQWVFSEGLCDLVGTLVAIFCTVSIYSLVLISLDRYIAVIYPLRYASIVTKNKGYCLIALTWLISSFIFVTYKLTANQFYFDKKSSVCGINFPAQTTFTLFIVTIVVTPGVLILGSVYFKIFMAARRQRRQISHINTPMSLMKASGVLDLVLKPLPEIHFKAKRVIDLKKVKMYLFIIGSFFIAWIPYSLLQVILCSTVIDVPQPVVFIIQWTAMANSFWNSIIYFLIYKKYRDGCRKTWKYIMDSDLCCLWRRCHKPQQ